MADVEPSTPAEQLRSDDVVAAALDVLDADGLDAVSMRRVAAELGVSPFPLYSRVGNKDALLDAMAAALVGDIAEQPEPGEPWPAYAARWSHTLRDCRRAIGDSRLLMRGWRQSMENAGRPLARLLRQNGIAREPAIEAVRLLMWSVLGHVVVELGDDHPGVDLDALFSKHVHHVIAGLVADLGLGSE